jgi:hypothetical protein
MMALLGSAIIRSEPPTLGLAAIIYGGNFYE